MFPGKRQMLGWYGPYIWLLFWCNAKFTPEFVCLLEELIIYVNIRNSEGLGPAASSKKWSFFQYFYQFPWRNQSTQQKSNRRSFCDEVLEPGSFLKRQNRCEPYLTPGLLEFWDRSLILALILALILGFLGKFGTRMYWRRMFLWGMLRGHRPKKYCRS